MVPELDVDGCVLLFCAEEDGPGPALCDCSTSVRFKPDEKLNQFVILVSPAYLAIDRAGRYTECYDTSMSP